MWLPLPLLRCSVYPIFDTADTNSSPETTGNLGTSGCYRYLNEMTVFVSFVGEVIDVDFNRFFNVRKRLSAVATLGVATGQAGARGHHVPVFTFPQSHQERGFSDFRFNDFSCHIAIFEVDWSARRSI